MGPGDGSEAEWDLEVPWKVAEIWGEKTKNRLNRKKVASWIPTYLSPFLAWRHPLSLCPVVPWAPLYKDAHVEVHTVHRSGMRPFSNAAL